MFSFLYFSKPVGYWMPLLFVQATILASSLVLLYAAWRGWEVKASRIPGFLLVVLSVAVYLFSQEVGWVAPEWVGSDMATVPMSFFMAIPICLFGLWMVVVDHRPVIHLKTTSLEIVAGIGLLHAFVANVFIMQNSW